MDLNNEKVKHAQPDITILDEEKDESASKAKRKLPKMRKIPGYSQRIQSMLASADQMQV